MDVFFFAGDYMKYDFDIIERGQLIKILESYKEITGTLDDMGMFGAIQEEYDHKITEEITDHFIKKMESKSNNVNLDEINTDELTDGD